ncbi:MAG: hypothetical protein IPG44_16010 [Anaerolineales bacterium]|nr:hypothetical protein [Anaerolineales bacterium]
MEIDLGGEQEDFGYDRWETDQEFAILESIHDDLRLYINFFQPSFKLIAKERIGNKTIKRRYSHDALPACSERKAFSAAARLMNLYLNIPHSALD